MGVGCDRKELGLEGEAAKRLTFECLEGEWGDCRQYDLTKDKFCQLLHVHSCSVARLA